MSNKRGAIIIGWLLLYMAIMIAIAFYAKNNTNNGIIVLAAFSACVTIPLIIRLGILWKNRNSTKVTN